MSSMKSARKLQILYFSKKNKKIKNLKNGEKKWPRTPIYTYYSHDKQKARYLYYKHAYDNQTWQDDDLPQ